MLRFFNYFRLLFVIIIRVSLIVLVLHFGKNLKGHQSDWEKNINILVD